MALRKSRTPILIQSKILSRARLQQSGHLAGPLTTDHFKKILPRKFQEVDIENAKMDIAPFLNDREKATLDLWSNDYFIKTVDGIQCIP